MNANATVATATIDGEHPEDERQVLHLVLDSDSTGDVYRWVAEDGSGTEVSARTIEDALEAGSVAWRNWTWMLEARK
jgi:hypothetical protein